MKSNASPFSPVEGILTELNQGKGARFAEQRSLIEMQQAISEMGITSAQELHHRVQDGAHLFIRDFWAVERIQKSGNSLRGNVFERLIEFIMLSRGVTPYFTQATLSMVPNVRFDLVLFPTQPSSGNINVVTGPEPICMSLKTSLRERYKQAELEAAAVRGVYRWAKCFLITLDAKAAKRVEEKIKNREVSFLDSVIVANDPKFDDFLCTMSSLDLSIPPNISVVYSNTALVGAMD